MLDHLGQHLLGPRQRPGGREHEAELRRQLEPANVPGRQHCGCALEQRPRCVDVAAAERAPSRPQQPVGRSAGEPVLVLAARAELDPEAVGLLEVVADDLVELGAVAGVALGPGGQALVQLRAEPLRHRVVGGVADEDVAEAEAVLAGEGARVGLDQPLAHERLQAAGDLADLVRRRQVGDGAPPEDLSDHGGALQHRQLVLAEPVEAGGEHRLHRLRHAQRVDGGERLEPAVALDEDAVLDEHPQHLLEEERVAAGRAADRVRGLGVERAGEVLEQRARLLARQRRQLDRRPTPRPAAAPRDRAAPGSRRGSARRGSSRRGTRRGRGTPAPPTGCRRARRRAAASRASVSNRRRTAA